MTNKKFWMGMLVMALAFGTMLTGCKMEPDDPKYYVEMGGISTTAYSLINSNPGITARQMLTYCNQYPVYNDQYKYAESGISRSELETELNSLNGVPGFSRAQFLRFLDEYGDVFSAFIAQNGDYIYVYVAKQ